MKLRAFHAGPGSRLAPGLLLIAAGAATGASVDTLRIDEPVGYWHGQGYVPLVPAIHPPTTHDRKDLIQVWLKLPPGGRIDVRWLADQQRHTLVYPEGTLADRVEYFYLGEGAPQLAHYAPLHPRSRRADQWTVADVRGTELRHGGQFFHVYRPVSGEPHAALTGWRWPRDDDAARGAATRLLAEHASRTPAALEAEPMSESGVAALRRLNDCAGCHLQNRPRIRLGDEDRAIERATDDLGFVVPNAVLRDECVVVHHRPADVNREDPFVSVRCANDAPATLEERDGEETFVCEDGSAPRGHRDVAAGLAADHPYTRAVCASREALHQRMTDAAREAFREAFAVCGIR